MAGWRIQGRDNVGCFKPEVLVESVISALAPEKVTMLSGVEEDVSFTLPRELR